MTVVILLPVGLCFLARPVDSTYVFITYFIFHGVAAAFHRTLSPWSCCPVARQLRTSCGLMHSPDLLLF